MKIVYKILFSSALTLSIVSITSLQAAMKSSSLSDFSGSSALDTKKLIDKEEFESVTDISMQHFCAVKEIGNILWDLINDELKKPDDSRCIQSVQDGRRAWPGSNPAFSQTIQGLFLIVSNETSCELWTPWGIVTLIASSSYTKGGPGAWKQIWSKLFKVISVQYYKTLDDDFDMGYHAEVYKVLAVKGKQLPEAVLRDLMGKYNGGWITYDTVKKVWAEEKVWAEMEAAYNQKKNK
jgi:hypothetical protein